MMLWDNQKTFCENFPLNINNYLCVTDSFFNHWRWTEIRRRWLWFVIFIRNTFWIMLASVRNVMFFSFNMELSVRLGYPIKLQYYQLGFFVLNRITEGKCTTMYFLSMNESRAAASYLIICHPSRRCATGQLVTDNMFYCMIIMLLLF
jgi:hypothetical protein